MVRPKMVADGNKGDVIIDMKNVTLRVRDRFLLPDTNWKIHTGEQWAVVGKNGTGKTSLVRAIIGDIPTARGSLRRYLPKPWKNALGYVSFELHRESIAAEEGRDEARFFSGDPGRQMTAAQFVKETLPPVFDNGHSLFEAADTLGIRELLGRSLRHLSTGEMRKILMTRALVKKPRLLILDEPFDGLDRPSRTGLKRIIKRLMDASVQMILITHRTEELPLGMTHVVVLGNSGVRYKGPIDPTLTLSPPSGSPGTPVYPVGRGEKANENEGRSTRIIPDILVEMRNVTVRYGEVTALEKLNWKMQRGENWAITGPNGSGKTTLLGLVSGEHPQAYANDIRLFGRRRGTGESIWEIKRNIGMVGMEFQIRYRKPITSFEVVLSGWFDSVGLYRNATSDQAETARKKMKSLGIENLADRTFTRLSHGEQRLVLIVRALVKFPIILLLDEPCQGLDGDNRKRVLDLVNFIGTRTASHLIYVTHHQKEIPPCVNRRLSLGKSGS